MIRSFERLLGCFEDFVGWLIKFLIGWLVRCLVVWLVGWLFDCLVAWLLGCFHCGFSFLSGF